MNIHPSLYLAGGEGTDKASCYLISKQPMFLTATAAPRSAWLRLRSSLLRLCILTPHLLTALLVFALSCSDRWYHTTAGFYICASFNSVLNSPEYNTSFLRAFQAHKEENWALPIMYAVALDLRIFANNADQQLVKKGKSKVGDMLEKAAELLMSCFRVCASDTRAGIEDSKKWGMLFLVNQLFKIYFKINKLHLCKPLIRAIDSSNLKDEYSMAQRVTYRYYVGRKAMFDSDFKQAEEYLSFAFEHCHRSSQKNKRMILIYLLPVKMLLGHMPTVQLLKKYDLMQFAEVTKAVSEGNLLLLNDALTKHETFFIRCGIFLILEKLKIITYRNLFKKVYLLLKTHQLSLDAFLFALKFMQVDDVDIDEVQCILANLIYMGHIKGYISHQHQKLVVSKQNPFPPLSTVC
ncbi:PCI domain-containing protein 2 isoform X1 [Pelecanus crispus]|uniref:PCI domain-containing protein 2 isoform X1 n=1 Tax=Pelecanus crispus TaxID=36300 RepID=UPI003F5D3633